jgi:23S rRNA (cytosine1962-C5)-methyltransferase
MSKAPHVVVGRTAIEAVRRGHPWVWRRGVTGSVDRLDPGAEVALVDPSGHVLGYGVWDPDSPIAVRVWTSDATRIDDDLFAARIASAMELRARLFVDGTTTAYRILHGEGDRTPGLVLDRYAHVAILRADGTGAEALVPRFGRMLSGPLEAAGIKTLTWRRSGTKRDQFTLETLFGPPPPRAVAVSEHGVRFLVDLAHGQKTGAFLDQRDNRQRVGAIAKDRATLNLFSYAGGFSLLAARGGAARTTSVDVASAAHATAQESFRAAGLDPDRHEFVTADAFTFLANAKQAGKRWDLVVSDPPSFAPSERALPRALAAYRALHRACAEVLAPGGIFCAASCSSHVDAAAFASTLDDAALGRSDLRMLALHGPPEDHPTLAAWPEGRYLKFAVMA